MGQGSQPDTRSSESADHGRGRQGQSHNTAGATGKGRGRGRRTGTPCHDALRPHRQPGCGPRRWPHGPGPTALLAPDGSPSFCTARQRDGDAGCLGPPRCAGGRQGLHTARQPHPRSPGHEDRDSRPRPLEQAASDGLVGPRPPRPAPAAQPACAPSETAMGRGHRHRGLPQTWTQLRDPHGPRPTSPVNTSDDCDRPAWGVRSVHAVGGLCRVPCHTPHVTCPPRLPPRDYSDRAEPCRGWAAPPLLAGTPQHRQHLRGAPRENRGPWARRPLFSVSKLLALATADPAPT